MSDDLSATTTSVDTWLDSTLDSVDAAEIAVLESASRAGLEEEEMHKLGMAVRESMVNAVVHGNRYSSHKRVHLRVTFGADRLRVVIVDEGDGFERSSIPDPLAEENLLKQSGRGLLLIQAFVDEFSVQPAKPRGTQVTLTKYIGGAATP